MAIHGTTKERLASLENELSSLRRTLARNAIQPRPQRSRNGKWLATLNGTLEAGGSTSADLYWFDGTDMSDAGQDVTVHDFFLGPEQELPGNSKVEVEFFGDSRWYVTEANAVRYFCTVTNDTEETGTSGTIEFDTFLEISRNNAGFEITAGDDIQIDNQGFYLYSLTIEWTGATSNSTCSAAVTNLTQGPTGVSLVSTANSLSYTGTITGIAETTADNQVVTVTYAKPSGDELQVFLTLYGIDMEPFPVP